MTEEELERIASMSNEEFARMYWAHFPRRVALARAEVHWRRSGIPATLERVVERINSALTRKRTP